ncbi:hypothetical protein BgiBS90_035922 [Biomphalaria glabrata]|nr:hypothetical protein BgiBS90_035922 [Biomphalaria glabrata]
MDSSGQRPGFFYSDSASAQPRENARAVKEELFPETKNALSTCQLIVYSYHVTWTSVTVSTICKSHQILHMTPSKSTKTKQVLNCCLSVSFNVFTGIKKKMDDNCVG